MHVRGLKVQYKKAGCCRQPERTLSVAGKLKMKNPNTVYSVSHADQVNFALSNVNFHVTGIGGPEFVGQLPNQTDLVLIFNGLSALALLAENGSTPETQRHTWEAAAENVVSSIKSTAEKGVRILMCGNTAKIVGFEFEDLIEGFSKDDSPSGLIEEGAVVRLAALQGMGYSYIRP
eukprot:TRINITY_DN4176_c0_g3_i2.p1 TRINITY_DN4176_c0_g3~~TRINITY_DN4176_c0_g3_i2.p1  ORF type:complete len:176 (+),score=35.90 TRINITY_DN4176_c0_g3_i2:152-679(+)